jgi:hypothetical protein
VAVFQADLKAMGIEDKVAGMTFSEFGRRAISNNSMGTDHGIAAPLFVFGSSVKTQMIGANPNLSDLDNNNIKMQYDFRQVYATMLTDWFGLDDSDANTLLFKSFDTVPVFRRQSQAAANRLEVFPNPADTKVIVQAPALVSGVQQIRLHDTRGLTYQMQGFSVNNPQQLELQVGSLPSGHYVVRINAAGQQLTGRLVVVH